MGEPNWGPLLPQEPISFPEDFLWGVASSAFQAEGGNVPNDWVAAANEGKVPPNPGNGFWELAEQDFVLLAELGFTHYRLSIEWSRVQPEPDRFDEDAIDRYKRMCEGAVRAGLTPWVNFFHFTHPTWFMEQGGFLQPENFDYFRRYVEHVGRALSPTVSHWHSQNESMVYVLIGYMLGENPPFVTDREVAMDMTEVVLRLHADSYRILKTIDSDCTVATIEVYIDPHPADLNDPRAVQLTNFFDSWYNETYWNAIRTGVINIAGRDPIEIPHLKGAMDLYGFNYYNGAVIGGEGDETYTDIPNAPMDTMGRYVYPQGMEDGLRRVANALPGVPIVVTENGCPTEDEDFRIRYIASHLAAIDRARKDGVDVRGYFHWTAVDNYEWLKGFSDARFGLVGFDPETKQRAIKQSGHWLAGVIEAGKLNPAELP